MRKYVIRRFIQLIPILLGITLLSFILTNIGTTDVIDTMESNQGVVMSEEEKDQLRQEMGLDKPLAQQYVIWLGNVLRGDMGESFVSGKDVFDTFISKLPATIYLTVTSIFLTVLISIPLGILSAVKQNKFLDYLIRFLSFIGNSLPNFSVSRIMPTSLSARTLSSSPLSSSLVWTTAPSTPDRRIPVQVSMLSLIKYIFIGLKLAQDHEGNDQAIQTHTFGKPYED